MSKPETSKLTASASLVAVIFAAMETAGGILSKEEIAAALAYVASTLED
jgi:hypothetical protein